MTDAGRPFQAGGGVPQPDDPVGARRGQGFAIGRETRPRRPPRRVPPVPCGGFRCPRRGAAPRAVRKRRPRSCRPARMPRSARRRGTVLAKTTSPRPCPKGSTSPGVSRTPVPAARRLPSGEKATVRTGGTAGGVVAGLAADKALHVLGVEVAMDHGPDRQKGRRKTYRPTYAIRSFPSSGLGTQIPEAPLPGHEAELR